MGLECILLKEKKNSVGGIAGLKLLENLVQTFFFSNYFFFLSWKTIIKYKIKKNNFPIKYYKNPL